MKKYKYNCILDLDSTLIFSIAHKSEPSRYNNLSLEYVDSPYYRIYLRPNLDNFLDFVFENFNVSIWTAASQDYALFIIENILLRKKDRIFDYIFFNYHTQISEDKYKTPKKLDLLWNEFKLKGYDKTNTFIVDDLFDVWDSQRDNTFRIKEFTVPKSVNDMELLNIKKEITDKYLEKKFEVTLF